MALDGAGWVQARLHAADLASIRATAGIPAFHCAPCHGTTTALDLTPSHTHRSIPKHTRGRAAALAAPAASMLQVRPPTLLHVERLGMMQSADMVS